VPVTDLSSVSDFLYHPREVALLSQKLGFQIEAKEYLIDVAIRTEPKQ